MNIFDLIKNHYQEYLFRLKKIYPDFLEQLKTIPVFPWKDEYNIADRNPELIETIDELQKLFREGKISEREYTERLNKLPEDYASRTEGIAFIHEGFVSFRDKVPSIFFSCSSFFFLFDTRFLFHLKQASLNQQGPL